MLVNYHQLNALPGRNDPLAAFNEFEDKFAQFGLQNNPEFPGALDPAASSVMNPGETRGFGDVLKEAIQGVSNSHEHALNMGVEFSLGKPIDPHQVMLAVTQAETQVHLTSAVTTRVAQSYQTLMNMQI
jgi:flagellar hook-basal body complex protein FliE